MEQRSDNKAELFGHNRELQLWCTYKDYLINSVDSCLITSENEAKFDQELET